MGSQFSTLFRTYPHILTFNHCSVTLLYLLEFHQAFCDFTLPPRVILKAFCLEIVIRFHPRPCGFVFGTNVRFLCPSMRVNGQAYTKLRSCDFSARSQITRFPSIVIRYQQVRCIKYFNFDKLKIRTYTKKEAKIERTTVNLMRIFVRTGRSQRYVQRALIIVFNRPQICNANFDATSQSQAIARSAKCCHSTLPPRVNRPKTWL